MAVKQVALITGASRGLGHHIALSLGHAGCTIGVGYCHDSVGARSTVAALEQANVSALAVQIDVTSVESIRGAVDTIESRLGAITILVNNAGARRPEMLEDITTESWDYILNVCLRGAFLCSQAVAPRIRAAGGGAIINIASIAALHPEPRSHHYVAAKSGILGLTKALALSLAPLVCVNCVAPGYISSSRHDEAIGHFRETVVSRIPLGRTADAAEIAEVVSFLGLRAPYITGQTIIVDGGLSLT